MRRLAVIPQSLAVIRRDDHQRVRVTVAERHDLEKPAHVFVGGSYFAQVGIPGEAGREGRRRLVGNVGLVQVDPEEPGLALVPPPPGRGSSHHLVAAPLRDGEAPGRTLRVGVVVDLEPPVQPVAGVQRERGDERRGAKSSVAEGFGGRRHRFGQHEAGVVAHPRARRASGPSAGSRETAASSRCARAPGRRPSRSPRGGRGGESPRPSSPQTRRRRPAACRSSPGRHPERTPVRAPQASRSRAPAKPADSRNRARRQARPGRPPQRPPPPGQFSERFQVPPRTASPPRPSRLRVRAQGTGGSRRRRAALLPPAMFERPRK